MKIAICDDEKQYVDQIYKYLKTYSLKNQKEFDIQSYLSASDFLKIITHEKFDIIFLDISMPVVDGLTIANHIRRFDFKVQIVFVTFLAEKMPRGYDVMASGFLVKPIVLADIEKIMERILYVYENSKTIPYEIKLKGGGNFVLNLYDTLYLESLRHYICIRTRDKEYEYRGNLTSESAKLSPNGFVQIHRAFLVNMSYIWIVFEDSITLTNSTELPIGAKYLADFKEIYKKYRKGGPQ